MKGISRSLLNDKINQTVMTPTQFNHLTGPSIRRALLAVPLLLWLLTAADTHGSMLYKNYVVRYDRGWDILCDPYQVEQGDWVLKIFRQKGEIAHDDFREFLGIFERLNPHVKDMDRIRPGQVVDIPLKKLAQGNLPGQSSGVVTIPFVMIGSPRKMLERHTRAYTIEKGDTVSTLIAKKFGGRFGNLTYSQGLKLFKAANPQIEDINRIYVGQRIYMPDPAIRERQWYGDLFDDAGNLVEQVPPSAQTEAATPQRVAASPLSTAPATPLVRQAPKTNQDRRPAADAAGVMGGRVMNKGTFFLPMKQGRDFEVDLSRFPMIELSDGKKVILTTQNQVMGVDLALIQSNWDDVKVVRVPEKASRRDILEAVLSDFAGDATTNRLAFDDEGTTISVSARWIRSEPSADGRTLRHTCITPIDSASQRTYDTIVRYLDQNDIVLKEISDRDDPMRRPSHLAGATAESERLDGSSSKTLVESFARLMGFHYSPDTSISFPYAGVQIQARSNLLSFGNGREVLIDYGDLYGNALEAIRRTGFEILQFDPRASSLDTIARLMETSGLYYQRAPHFYGAERPVAFNTVITVNGILIPSPKGENRLITDTRFPDLIERFIRDQGIGLVWIETTDKG